MSAFPPGAYTALVTPFTRDRSGVDWEAFERLVEQQVEAGLTGLVPCGTTGEGPTLSPSERDQLIRVAVRGARGRAVVVAGIGTNDTQRSIEGARLAVAAGAEAVMLVMPYYNRPSQEGLLLHVSAVARAVDRPLMVYNIPSRTGVELEVDTLLRVLEQCPNVVALKDASGGVVYCQRLLARAKGRIRVLSGDDPLTVPLISVGAEGVVSVTGNLLPRPVVTVVEAALAGRMAEAREQNARLFPVHRALFSEPSPAPVKAALALKGKMEPTVRPPLIEASARCRAELAEVLAAFEAS